MSYEMEITWRLASALGIGLLIGLERGWRDRDLQEGRRIAGFRTCAIVSLLGAASGLLGEKLGGGLPIAAMGLTLGVLLAVGYWRSVRDTADLSVTTAVAVLIAFALGTLAGVGLIAPAAASAVVVALLLGLKPEMHGLLTRLDRAELLATLRLLLISVVILPLLPNEPLGPFAAINPFELWLLVVLIAAISFVGYFAMKLAGARRGILLTGILGGLASSTAVTLNFARLAREQPSGHRLLSAGIVIAATVMFPRLLLVIAMLAPDLIMLPLLAFGPATLVGAIVALWFAYRAAPLTAEDAARVEPRNPLNLSTAIQFGAFLALLSLLSRAVQEWSGTAGLYVLSALSGIADVDAITLSLVSGGGWSSVDGTVIGTAIIIAAAVNTAVKAGLAAAIGGGRVGWDTLAGLGAALAAGGIALAARFVTI